jgi:hypothetical protein
MPLTIYEAGKWNITGGPKQNVHARLQECMEDFFTLLIGEYSD